MGRMKPIYFPVILMFSLGCTFSSAMNNVSITVNQTAEEVADAKKVNPASVLGKEKNADMRVNVTSGKAIVDKLKSAATNDDELLEQKLEKATQPAVLDKSEMKEESLPASKEVTSVVAAKTAQTKSKSGLLKPNNSQPNNQAEAAEKFAGKFSDEDFAKVEDSHFIYYLVVFGVLMAVLYIGAHNKKKILGLLIEGRRPTGGSRRGSIRYRRLSQREDASETLSYRDNESNIIY